MSDVFECSSSVNRQYYRKRKGDTGLTSTLDYHYDRNITRLIHKRMHSNIYIHVVSLRRLLFRY